MRTYLETLVRMSRIARNSLVSRSILSDFAVGAVCPAELFVAGKA